MNSDLAKPLRLGDLVLLVCAIGVALVTWATLSRAGGEPLWKPVCGVAATLLLTLAALTPRDAWAITMRRVIGGWLMAAPWVLAFAEVSAARWAYVLSGAVIAGMSMSRLPGRAGIMVLGAPAPGDAPGGPHREAFTHEHSCR